MSSKYLLQNVELEGKVVDIAIADSLVKEIGPSLSLEGATKIDGKGSVALPGLVDLHTHLREPGKEDAETVQSGSQAGARGGFVALSAMANTSPVDRRAHV